jgi:multicomponent Na+:H+ antiporter subunit E
VLLANMLLALAWAALHGEFSLANLLTGQVLGYFVLLGLSRGGVLEPSPYIGRVHVALGLIGFFIWELVRANMRLAADVATPQFHMRPGIIALPLDITKDSQILLLSMLINLTPGSVALDVTPARRFMYVHVMYIDTPDSAATRSSTGSSGACSSCSDDGACTVGLCHRALEHFSPLSTSCRIR